MKVKFSSLVCVFMSILAIIFVAVDNNGELFSIPLLFWRLNELGNFFFGKLPRLDDFYRLVLEEMIINEPRKFSQGEFFKEK